MNDFKRSAFLCGHCGTVTSATRDQFRIDETTGDIFAVCSGCGKEAPESWWMDNLRQGSGKQTGPVTDAGKQRCSRNAVKHGGFSSSHLYPRKPGDYPECDRCQDRPECESDLSGYCHRKIEVYNKFMLAISSGDPQKIQEMVAGNFASMQQLLGHLFKDVFSHGSTIESPIIVKDAEGNPLVMKDVVELKANPAVSRIIDLMVRWGMTLPEFGITPKGQKDRELLQGHLAADAGDRRTADEYRKSQSAALKNLGDVLKRSEELRKADPRTQQILKDRETEIELDEAEENRESNDDRD